MSQPAQQQPYYLPGPQSYVPAMPPPGRSLGIAGFVTAFLVPPVGLALSITALVQSRKAKHKNGLALAGIIISALVLIAGIILGVVLIRMGVNLVETCRDLGPGTHVVGRVTYTCS